MHLESTFAIAEVPDHLPVLERGRHEGPEQGACAMEAASWLCGESWSDHPRSVHPVIAQIARATNDTVSDDERQRLWPLILASIGTRCPHRPIVSWRLRRLVRRAELARSSGNQLCALWKELLVEFDRRAGDRVGMRRVALIEEDRGAARSGAATDPALVGSLIGEKT